MNELITPARGIPVPYQSSELRHLGVNFLIDPDKLESNIQQLLLQTEETKRRLGDAARDWFLETDRQFRSKLPQVISRLTSD